MNNFIVSGKGFLKSTKYNKDSKQIDIEWTNVLREAQMFNAKTAITVIQKNNIEAFMWNPYKEEEPAKGKWAVTQRSDYYNFIDEEHHKALEWKPEKVIMNKKTDVKFLTSKGVEKEVYYNSYEEALEICQDRNLEIIKELQEKMEKMIKI